MRRIAFQKATLGIATLAALMGCASYGEKPGESLNPRGMEELPRVAKDLRGQTNRPVIALVLGGGGLRGFAHIGVLSALEESGIQPDIIVGTSAGSVVGAAYASGRSPEQIRSAAQNVRIASLVDFTLSTKGFIRGNKLANWVDELTGGLPIEKFPRRFAAVATDLTSGRPVLLDSGPAGAAVRASSAVPGMNIPVAYKNGYLIDGGVTSLVPVRIAKAMGADIVIAVDIYCQGTRPSGTNIPSVLGSVMQTQSCLLAESEIALADVLISPNVAVPGMSSKDAQTQLIQVGYEAAHTAIGKWQSGGAETKGELIAKSSLN